MMPLTGEDREQAIEAAEELMAVLGRLNRSGVPRLEHQGIAPVTPYENIVRAIRGLVELAGAHDVDRVMGCIADRMSVPEALEADRRDHEYEQKEMTE